MHFSPRFQSTAQVLVAAAFSIPYTGCGHETHSVPVRAPAPINPFDRSLQISCELSGLTARTSLLCRRKYSRDTNSRGIVYDGGSAMFVLEMSGQFIHSSARRSGPYPSLHLGAAGG